MPDPATTGSVRHPSPNTGLAAPDVFAFGNLVGETGDGNGAAGWNWGGWTP